MTKQTLTDKLESLPCKICFVDGNHENFSAIYSYPIEEWNAGKTHRIRRNIYHLMRGQVYEIDGKRIFTMGGAYSIDKLIRMEGVSWWPDELPSNEEYNEATKNLKENGMAVDYIITHTMPRETILRYGKRPDPHDMQLTGFLEWILYEVQFSHWYCGHWHADADLSEKMTILWHEVRQI